MSLNSFENLKSVSIEAIASRGSSVYEIKNYNILKEELIGLKDIGFYKSYVNKIVDSIPTLVRDKDKSQFDGSVRNLIYNNLELLKTKLYTIIELYESFNISKVNIGIDVLMPKFETIDEYSECINDLKTIFKNYRLFTIDDKTAEYSFNDIGS